MVQDHVNNCPEPEQKFKCTVDFLSYYCRFRDTGRSSHYYEIKKQREILDFYEENLEYIEDIYYSKKYEYEKNLAIKENRYTEYQQKLDEEFDNYTYKESLSWSMR
jgi:hypothetical protein